MGSGTTRWWGWHIQTCAIIAASASSVAGCADCAPRLSRGVPPSCQPGQPCRQWKEHGAPSAGPDCARDRNKGRRREACNRSAHLRSLLPRCRLCSFCVLQCRAPRLAEGNAEDLLEHLGAKTEREAVRRGWESPSLLKQGPYVGHSCPHRHKIRRLDHWPGHPLPRWTWCPTTRSPQRHGQAGARRWRTPLSGEGWGYRARAG